MFAANFMVRLYWVNAFRLLARYDALGRRRVRKEYSWTGSAWSLTNEMRYVYDGMLMVQERDANNLPIVTYTRGNDLSGSLQDAGGIGGLLARTDNTQPLSTDSSATHAYYHNDGNGNVTALVNAKGYLMARYNYDPFGNLLGTSGPLAEANTYRFSSKEYHPNSGLYYYGYRFYEPSLQRWLNQDPAGEFGGNNLYRWVRNAPNKFIDPYGKDAKTIGPITITIPFTTEDWEEASQSAHEKQHRDDFLCGFPGWKKEQRGFAAEIPVLKKQIADTQAIIDFQKKAFDANIAAWQSMLNNLNQALSTAETIANNDEAAMDYWNAAARRWYQDEVHPPNPNIPSVPAATPHPLDVQRGGPGRRY